MNREARNKKLLLYLEQAEKTDNNENLDEQDEFFIAWFQIRKICLAIKTDSNELDNHRQLAIVLLKKFEMITMPKLVNFRKTVESLSFPERLTHFYKKINGYTDSAKPFISTVPIAAYEIYENALQFINIYRFAFNRPEYYQRARKNIVDHLTMLKQAFEVEAGTKDLEKYDNELTDELRATSEGKIDSKVNLVSSADNETIKEDDLVIEALTLPESENEYLQKRDHPAAKMETSNVSQPLSTDFSIAPSDYTIENKFSKSDFQLDHSEFIIPSIPRPTPLAHPTHIQKNNPAIIERENPQITAEKSMISTRVNAYIYQKWFPTTIWSRFGALRYCDRCGRVREPATGICRGCGSHFQRTSA